MNTNCLLKSAARWRRRSGRRGLYRAMCSSIAHCVMEMKNASSSPSSLAEDGEREGDGEAYG